MLSKAVDWVDQQVQELACVVGKWRLSRWYEKAYELDDGDEVLRTILRVTDVDMGSNIMRAAKEALAIMDHFEGEWMKSKILRMLCEAVHSCGTIEDLQWMADRFLCQTGSTFCMFKAMVEVGDLKYLEAHNVVFYQPIDKTLAVLNLKSPLRLYHFLGIDKNGNPR